MAPLPPNANQEPSGAPAWSRADAALLGAMALASVVLTWPLCRDFGTVLAGDWGDGWQTSWGFWWVRRALAQGNTPFWTDLLFHPHGTSLIFQTFVMPEALWTWFLPTPLMAHNAAVLGSFIFSGWAMYGLARELTAGARGPSAVAALAFTFAPYHFAHALGHLHLVAMHWVPLFAWALLRTLRRPKGLGVAAPLAGALAALAGLASPYNLLACGVIALMWGPFLWAQARPSLRELAKRAGAALVAFLVVLAPLIAELPRGLALGPYYGAHGAEMFSADLWGFFVPGARSAWADLSSGLWSRFSGNAAENGIQLGAVLLVLASLGAIRVRAARPLFFLALTGVLLSLGPSLHVAGEVRPMVLPWNGLVKLAPFFEFSGVPVRLAFWATFALPLCAALALTKLPSRLTVAAAVLMLAEFWPKPQPQSEWATPPPMLQWAQSSEPFAVFDLSGHSRALWHQTLHQRPMLGGYVTRSPQRHQDWLRTRPVIRQLLGDQAPQRKVALTRVDPNINFDWGHGSPAPELERDGFGVQWEGSLLVPRAGEYEFSLTSDDGSLLWLDGELVVDNAGVHPMETRAKKVRLEPGAHPLRVEFQEVGGGAAVRLEWSGPGVARQAIPAEAFAPGLTGVYSNPVFESGLVKDVGRNELRQLGLRYVILGADARQAFVLRELELPVVYEGNEIRIYEVPPA